MYIILCITKLIRPQHLSLHKKTLPFTRHNRAAQCETGSIYYAGFEE